MEALAPYLLALLQATADSAGARFVVERNWLDTLANIAQSLVSVLVMVMLIIGVTLLYALRKSIDELSKLVKAANDPVRAAIVEVREVTGEVRAIAKSLRAPVALAGETIESVSDRVRGAMDRVEDRLQRFDLLVEIAQEEAEGAVVSAASLLRGVRAGGTVMRRSFGLSKDSARDEREDEEDDDTDAVDETDDAAVAATGALLDDDLEAEAPRIRSRAASHR